MTETPTAPKVEVKNVKHIFTEPERNQIGGDLARAIAGLRGTQAEFDQVKASYKARTTESEARIDNLSTSLMNGFDMRNEKCVVIYRPQDRKKDYYLERDWKEWTDAATGEFIGAPIQTEDMTADDFQAELIQAESKFDNREEIDLFSPTGTDRGVLVIGRFAGKWFGALRVTIGKISLSERLDSEQRSFKERPDAVAHGVKRATQWAKDNMKEHAKGFEESFRAVAEAHKERAE